MTYKVLIYDNFHYMDETERYELGEFPTLDSAIAASRRIVDEYLLSAYQPGMTAQELFGSYTSFGEDPFIVAMSSNETGVLFSAWDYTKHRCDEFCRLVQDRDEDG